MKVLFLSIYDPYEHVYGAGNHLFNLSQSLLKMGCEIHILVPGSKNDSTKRQGIYYHTIKSSPLRNIGKGMLFSLLSFRLVNKLCDTYHIDIIHSESPSGFGYGLIARKKLPFIVTLHGTSFGELSSYLNVPPSQMSTSLLRDALIIQPIMAFLTNIEYKKATKLIAVSGYLAKEAAQYYHLQKQKLSMIYNGVNISNMFNENRAAPITILFVGRLVWRKGAQYLLQATPDILAKYPQAKIMIVGTGDQNKKLQKIVDELKIKKSVEFLGKVSAKKLQQLYTQATVFIQPSLYEPLGIAVLEAMSHKTPVIASSVGGIPEIIENGINGFLVRPKNANEISESIIALLSKPKLEITNNGFKTIQSKFTWGNNALRTLELYKELTIPERRK